MTNGVYPNSNGGATISGAGSPIPAGPPHVVRYALNCGPGLNIPAWAVYIALAHFSDDHGLSERTHREIADAIDAGSVSTVKVAIQHLEYFGKVEVTRRPGATAGRNLPNVYRITGEAPIDSYSGSQQLRFRRPESAAMDRGPRGYFGPQSWTTFILAIGLFATVSPTVPLSCLDTRVTVGAYWAAS